MQPHHTCPKCPCYRSTRPTIALPVLPTFIIIAVGLPLLALGACSDDSAGTQDGGGTDANQDAGLNDATFDDAALNDAAGDARSNSDASTGPDACPDPVPSDYCEAQGNGQCYYVDPANGDDANPGTWDHPWRTFINANNSIYTQYRPDTWVGLKPGDVLYLMGGVHDSIYHPGDDSGPDGGGSAIIYMRQIQGEQQAPIVIKGFPGTHPILDPGHQGRGIAIAQSSWVVIQGIEIQNAYNRGVRISECDHVSLSRLLIHDTDGTVGDNVAGLELLGSTNVEVAQSVLYDNYDRTAAAAGSQTANSCNMVIFRGGNITVHHSIFYQTHDRSGQESGCGLKYKHASTDPEATFEVFDCTFENLKYFAIGTGTGNSSIHHNIIYGAPVALITKDFGGITHQFNQHFSYNTIVDAMALSVSPSLDWIDDTNGPWDDVRDIGYDHNIVMAPMENYTLERRTVLLNSYMSDELYLALKDEISFQTNCYFNPSQPVSFGFAGAGGNYGDLGGFYDLSEWQATYSYDMDSVEADPGIADPAGMDFSLAADSPCLGLGALEGGHAPPLDKDFVFSCEDQQ